ncbi:hypothetical protein B0H16DRAFT_1455204 [Mycena metata]|uniref:Anaphase-promoting complex subunit 5 n=1 Tax=Mycena metata TaxID=1033252 RepID=A0AAD7JIC8_9AGAR|nr:hypothetical protein B0H16DRAFT_1455204 [Mycena metata]
MQQSVKTVQQIRSNTGNLNQILGLGLDVDNPDLVQTIRCTICLNSYHRLMGHSPTVLMDRIPGLLPLLDDPALAAEIDVELIHLAEYNPLPDPERFIAQTMEHFKNFDDPALETLFYLAAGYYEFYVRNDRSRSMEFLERGLSLARTHADHLRESIGFIHLAMIKWNSGDYRAAHEHAQTAYELSRLSGNLYQQTVALRTEAQCCTQLGDYRGSILLSQKARELLVLCNMSTGTLYQLLVANEAEVHLLKSEYSEAHRIYAQSIRETSPEQSPYNHALSLLSAAEIEIMIGAPDCEVRPKIALARKLFTAQGNQIAVMQCDMVHADLELREGNEGVAGASFRRCLASSWSTNGEIRSYCLERLGDISRWKRPSTSSNWAVVYLADSQSSHNMLALHKALLFMADVFISGGEEDTASALLVVALDGFTSMDVHRGRAECLLRLGQVSFSRGEVSRAVQFWSQARLLFERASQLTKVKQIDTLVAGIEKEVDGHHDGNSADRSVLVAPSGPVRNLENGVWGTSKPERAA